MSQLSAKAQAYINYINDLRQFSNMPLWQRELASYNSKPSKPITLPKVDKDSCLKAFNSLPSCNYYSKSYNLDNLELL